MTVSVRVPRFKLVVFGVVLAFLGVRSVAHGQTTVLEPDDPRWEFSGEARASTYQGQDVLYLRTGSAMRPDIRFGDGTIEFDMLPTDRRTFLGLLFRVPERGHMEDIYFRLHKSRLPDAVQYSPDYRSRGQWQLYHGPAATGRATYVPRTWQHVRIEVRGDRAAVFVGDEPVEPNLVVDRLRAGIPEGYLGFWGNFPGADTGDPATALVRDITVRPGITSYDFPAPQPESEPPGVISAWSVSHPFVRPAAVVEELPTDVVAEDWHTVESEPSGLVPLDRYVERPEDGPAAVLAGIRLRSATDRLVPIDLGFSDDASVFLNGRLLYSGKHGFSHNFPRRQGLITLDQARLYLPLRSGENDLVIAVSEVFGGWGLMGRIEDRDGLVVGPLH